MYTLSIAKHFPNVVTALVRSPADVTAAAFRVLAREIDDAVQSRHTAHAAIPA
jgi:hypothetical protein